MQSISQSKHKSRISTINKKIYQYSYYLTQQTSISPRVFCLFTVLFDLPFYLIMSLQAIWSQEIQNDDSIKLKSLNFVLLLNQFIHFDLITDCTNAIIFALAVLTAFAFMKSITKSNEGENTNKTYLNKITSFLFIIVTRFLIKYFIAIQILTIRCRFQPHECTEDISMAQLIANCIGFLLCLMMLYLKHKYLNSYLPNQKHVLAQPINNYQIFIYIQQLAFIVVVPLEDLIEQNVDNFVILIPLLLIQLIIVYIIMMHRSSYSKLIDLCNIFKESLLLVVTLFAILIDGTDQLLNLAVIFITLLCTVLLAGMIYLIREDRFSDSLDNFSSARNEQLQETNLYTLIKQAISNDEIDHMKLNMIFQKHISTCTDIECPCIKLSYQSEKLSDSEQNPDFSDLHQSYDDSEHRNFKSYKPKLKNHEELLSIVLAHYQKLLNSKRIKYLQVFLKIQYLDHIQTSYYELGKIKAKQKDKKMHQWLKLMILNKANNFQIKHHVKQFDVDSALDVDQNFYEYKRMIYETSMLVNQFWINLSKKDFVMKDLIDIGVQVVDKYIEIKSLFEFIMKKKQDFKEVVKIYIYFNQDVMNFEAEGMQAMNQLRNISLKMRIANITQYKGGMGNQGLMIITCSAKTKMKIMLVNSLLAELLGYNKSYLLEKNINMLIPSILEKIHDSAVQNHLSNENTQYLNIASRIVWLKKFDGNILPAKISIQTCISEEKGMVLVAHFNPFEEQVFENFACNMDQSFTLLAEDNGYIISVSTNFQLNFLNHENIDFEEDRINIDEIFMGLDEYSKEDLKKGINTQIKSNFLCSQKKTVFDSILLINVKVAFRFYELQDALKITEVIFMVKERENTLFTKSDIFTTGIVEGNKTPEEVNFVDEQATFSNASSGSSTSTRTISTLKQNINLIQIPPSLQNMKRAIIIFFLVVLSTSFAILSVSIICKTQFISDSNSVKQSIYLFTQLSNLRLSQRFLSIKSRPNISPLIETSFIELQQQLQYSHEQLRITQNLLQSTYYKKSDSLTDLLDHHNLTLVEIGYNQTLRSYNTTFFLGIADYIQKTTQFMTMQQSVMSTELGDFQITKLPQNASQIYKDLYFIIVNGEEGIRDFSLALSHQQIADGNEKISKYYSTVVIIIVTCVGIASITAISMIPVTFALDSEQHDIVEKWILIRDPAKLQVIQNVGEFILNIQNEILEQVKRIEQNQDKSEIDLEVSDVGTTMFMSKLQNVSTKQNELLSNEKQSAKSLKEGVLKIQNYPVTKQSFQKFLKMDSQPNSSQSLVTVHKENQDANDSQIDEEINDSKQYFQEGTELQDERVIALHQKVQRKQLGQIYKYKKIQKILLILGFLAVINIFYGACYLMTHNQFQKSRDSFTYTNLVNKRPACLAESLQLLIETYLQNTTIRLNGQSQDAFDYIKNDCFEIEHSYSDLLAHIPPQLRSIENYLQRMDTREVCSLVFDGDEQDSCFGFQNDIFGNGLKSSVQNVYHYILQKFTKVLSVPPIQRTTDFNEQDLFKDRADQYFTMMFKYIFPIFDSLDNVIEEALINYINKGINVFIGVFSIFVVYLIVSLILALKVLMEKLKRQVFRTRILLKIIPVDELYFILHGNTASYRKQMKISQA